MWLWWFIASTMHFNARLFTVTTQTPQSRPLVGTDHTSITFNSPHSLEMSSTIVEELDSGDVKPNGLT